MTIRGYYRRNRDDQPPAPHIGAWLAIPSLGWVGDVEFLLDTGADATTLLPDTSSRLGIDIRSIMSPVVRVHGVGGGVSCKSVEADISFPDESHSNGHRKFSLQLVLVEGETSGEREGKGLTPGLLGRDILNLCECTFNAATGRVTLEPL